MYQDIPSHIQPRYFEQVYNKMSQNDQFETLFGQDESEIGFFGNRRDLQGRNHKNEGVGGESDTHISLPQGEVAGEVEISQKKGELC